MKNTIRELVKEELCPDGVWKYSNQMNSIYQMAIRKFPLREASEDEERYPTTQNGMGAYLDKFFARHYFQVQDSLLDYMTSDSFLDIISNGYINILDIGSGPAVASLAIADLIRCITEVLYEIKIVDPKVFLSFVLNDTSDICLGLGKEILFNYFQRTSNSSCVSIDKAFFINKQFPETFSQFERISKNLKPFNIVNFSYVIVPLDEQDVDISSEIMNFKKVCAKDGQILIVQDKYNEELIRRVENNAEKRSITHLVYSQQNDNDSYTYEYYRLLKPCE